MRTLSVAPGFESWRSVARDLLAQRVPPERVIFVAENATKDDFLPGMAPADVPARRGSPEADRRGDARRSSTIVPRRFVSLARRAAHHRDPQRYALLYRLLWRLQTEAPGLLQRHSDADVAKLRRLDQAVRRAIHKTHAFVRFAPSPEGPLQAYHRPEHPVLRLAAPFFVERFPNHGWEICTPDESAIWDRRRLVFGPGRPAPPVGGVDPVIDDWRAYYGAVFNPARVNLRAMKAELPVHHWKTMPELETLPAILRDAPTRVRAMRDRAAELRRPPIGLELPRRLEDVHAASGQCTACPLHGNATRPVPGEGPANARIALVGEQPGDEEDRQGRPFVGPAGRLLDELLCEAGIERSAVYVTNAVKHFKHEIRGKRRLHKRPAVNEVRACRPLLEAELAWVRPRVLVALGATAARSLYGARFSLARERGGVFEFAWAPRNLGTWHPAAVLRAEGVESDALREELLEDLRRAKELAGPVRTGPSGSAAPRLEPAR